MVLPVNLESYDTKRQEEATLTEEKDYLDKKQKLTMAFGYPRSLPDCRCGLAEL